MHRTVDDTPYGGGPGMVMRPEPWGRALDELVPPRRPIAAPTTPAPPSDRADPDRRAVQPGTGAELARRPWLIFACGRYEGIDARVVEHAGRADGGARGQPRRLCAVRGRGRRLVIAEAVSRLLPGVLGNAAPRRRLLRPDGLLEAPAYTKPADLAGLDVPAVLRSGDHGAIARWRREQSLSAPRERRPDLLA